MDNLDEFFPRLDPNDIWDIPMSDDDVIENGVYKIESFQKHDDELPFIVMTNKETGGTVTCHFRPCCDYWAESAEDCIDSDDPDFGVFKDIEIVGIHYEGDIRSNNFSVAYLFFLNYVEWEEKRLCPWMRK